jgi:threonine dehydrogenase-like Zn-dependent dehydrogenase
MRALCWHDEENTRYDTVPDPVIQNPQDAIIKVSHCAICGADLHSMGGFVPEKHACEKLPRETIGEVVEVGCDNRQLRAGDRVAVALTICCGECLPIGRYSLVPRLFREFCADGHGPSPQRQLRNDRELCEPNIERVNSE